MLIVEIGSLPNSRQMDLVEMTVPFGGGEKRIILRGLISHFARLFSVLFRERLTVSSASQDLAVWRLPDLQN